ncbi:MAG: hypothetical protein KGL57_10590 [Burkholderiales bacterium]|nr:hypothetical protein [Burkholderiales bacterium]
MKKFGWLLSLFLLTSFGGGTNVASNGVGSGGTGSYTSGPVSGLGSIIVNGVRYDVSGAAVQDDEDTAGFDQSRVQLGMLVEVQGSSITAGSSGQTDTATATSVKVASDFIGQVTAVTTGSGSTLTGITLFGRNIAIDSKTVYTAPIQVNDYVIVYGLVSATGYTATRIETLPSRPAVMKLSGVVRNLSVSPTTFTLGTQTIDYGAAAPLPLRVRNGALVRVRVAPTQLFGMWVASRVRAPAAAVSDSKEARFKGLIGELTDQKHFVVNGVTVDASSASGPGVTLTEGARIEVEGQMVNGVLIATSVESETQVEIDAREVELHGLASAVSSSQMTVRGVVVSYDSSVLRNGPVTDLRTCVEVRGTSFNNSNQLVATEISIESCFH